MAIARAGAAVSYDLQSPAGKPEELRGFKCKKCGSQSVYRSRPRPEDTFMRWAGFVSCRCGSCLHRFQIWGLWPRRTPSGSSLAS